MGCPFCEIVGGYVERDFAASWPDAVAFEPLGPVVPGHVLVVPRTHVVDAIQDPAVTARVMGHVAELAQRPCNIITSASAEATQTVFHLHVHIVPRSTDDGLKLPWTTAQRGSRAEEE